jgi:hypothetical protein
MAPAAAAPNNPRRDTVFGRWEILPLLSLIAITLTDHEVRLKAQRIEAQGEWIPMPQPHETEAYSLRMAPAPPDGQVYILQRTITSSFFSLVTHEPRLNDKTTAAACIWLRRSQHPDGDGGQSLASPGSAARLLQALDVLADGVW